MHCGVFLQGAPGKDGDTGSPGAPGPAVSVFEHLRVQGDVNLLWQTLICPALWCFRARLERKESRVLQVLLDSRCAHLLHLTSD